MSQNQPPYGAYPGAPPPGYPAATPQGYPQPVPAAAPYPQPSMPQGYPQQPFPQQGYPQQMPTAPYQQPPPAQYTQQPQPQYGQMPAGPRRPTTDPLAGFDTADPTGSRLPHFNVDRYYRLRCTNMQFFQGRKDDFVNVEFDILESDDPHLPPGRAAKYMIKMGQDMSQPNLKAVLGALMGYSTKEDILAHVTSAAAKDALERGTMVGKTVELRTTGTKTRADKDFTVHNWYVWSGGVSQTVMAPVPSQAQPPQPSFQPPMQPQQLPFHPQAAAMGQGYVPNMAPPPAAAPPWAPPPQAQVSQFPPPGWYANPNQPGTFHNGKEIVSEYELRARVAAGRA